MNQPERRKKQITPYQRIMRAAEKDRGVRFSAEEVFNLSLDDAIATRSLLDDEADDGTPEAEATSNKGWERI